MIGRFIGFAVMRVVSPGKTLAFNSLLAIALVLLGTFGEGSLAMWAVIPKSLGFYYYYHLSGIFIAIALAAAFHLADRPRARYWFAVGALALFIWFYPIISAAALPSPQAFNRWMCFDSWR